MVKVTPKNDALRKALYHPSTLVKFPEEGPAEWPNDQFTQRRIRDGDVTAEEGEKKQTDWSPPEQPKQSKSETQ